MPCRGPFSGLGDQAESSIDNVDEHPERSGDIGQVEGWEVKGEASYARCLWSARSG